MHLFIRPFFNIYTSGLLQANVFRKSSDLSANLSLHSPWILLHFKRFLYNTIFRRMSGFSGLGVFRSGRRSTVSGAVNTSKVVPAEVKLKRTVSFLTYKCRFKAGTAGWLSYACTDWVVFFTPVEPNSDSKFLLTKETISACLILIFYCNLFLYS